MIMRKIDCLFILLAHVLGVAVANADPVEIGGLFYNLSPEEMTATVTKNPDHYQGDIVIPETVIYDEKEYQVTAIDHTAFLQCRNLTSVIIPEGVASIGALAFQECSSLTSIAIPNSVKSIGDQVFAWCDALTTVTLGNGLTSISGCAFLDCSALTSVTFPERLKTIDGAAFEGCSALSSVTIPEGVTSIGLRAFEKCVSLTSVTIPNSVTSIGQRAFWGCNQLSEVTVRIQKPFRIIGRYYDEELSTFDLYTYTLGTLYVPYNTKQLYEETRGWRDFVDIKEIYDVGIAQPLAEDLQVKAENCMLTIEGTADGTQVCAFDTDGILIGRSASRNGVATIPTTMKAGSMAIVKVDKKTIKVLMK
jgi:hypothetical protein